VSSPSAGDGSSGAEPHEHVNGSRPVDLSKPVAGTAPAEVPPIWAVGQPHPAAAPAWQVVFDQPRPRMTARDWMVEVLAALGVAAVLSALGYPLAHLWAAVSPRVVLEMTGTGPAYRLPNPEEYIAAEAVYLLISAVAGLLAAIVVWLLARRRRGPLMLLGLAVGTVVGAAVMSAVGQDIGLAEYQRLLREAPAGTRFEVPVKVRSGLINPPLVQGAILLESLIAVAAYTLMAGFYATASLRPERDRAHIVPVQPGDPPPVFAGDPVPVGDQVSLGGPVPPDPAAERLSWGSPDSPGHPAAPAPPAAD
jgi:hypothetical protein